MKKKGFTLTEIILTMSVAAIIIIMGLLVYKKVHDKAEENLIITILNNINSNTDALFGYGYVKNSNHTFTQAQQDYIFKEEFPNSPVKVSQNANGFEGDNYFIRGDLTLKYTYLNSDKNLGADSFRFAIIIPKDICSEVIQKIIMRGDYIVEGKDSNTYLASQENMSLSLQAIKNGNYKISQDLNDIVSVCNDERNSNGDVVGFYIDKIL